MDYISKMFQVLPDPEGRSPYPDAAEDLSGPAELAGCLERIHASALRGLACHRARPPAEQDHMIDVIAAVVAHVGVSAQHWREVARTATGAH
ncbi:hypothetical protein [Paraburkholderia youngii]|uniref:hypothetical protein n=1 Tax=Paraburkholderia youngii TaxID=2782701 RepID=UPI003D262E84